MDERSERVAGILTRPLIGAALLTIPATIIEESHLGRPWPQVATGLNWAIWAVFLLELVVMLAIVPSRREWLTHHILEVAIVVLTPPVLLTAIQPIRLLRLLRLFRLMRLAPLFRFLVSEEGLRYIALLALLTAVAGGTAFAAVENVSVGNGIYWAIQTMTTVGYGDIVPHTTAGKAVAVVVMLVGIGSATLVIGAVAQRFTTTTMVRELSEAETGDDEALLAKVKEVATALEDLQATIERRRARS